MNFNKEKILESTIKIWANTFEAICHAAKIDINAAFNIYHYSLMPKLKKWEELSNNYTKLNKEDIHNNKKRS